MHPFSGYLGDMSRPCTLLIWSSLHWSGDPIPGHRPPPFPPPPPSLPSPRTLERGTVPIHQNHQQARSTFLAAPSPMVFVDARSLPVDGQRVGLRREPFTLQADRVIGFRSCTDDVSRRDGYLSPPQPTPLLLRPPTKRELPGLVGSMRWALCVGPVG